MQALVEPQPKTIVQDIPVEAGVLDKSASATKKVLFVLVDHYKTERSGIQILSSICLQEGVERDLLILNSMSVEECLKKAVDYQPDIIAYSAMTYEHIDLEKFNKLLKKTGMEFIAIFGGIHYTFNCDQIHKDEAIDVVCQGEGEVAWRHFIQSVRDGEDYSVIDKLWVRKGDKIIQNPVGELIAEAEMDTIPYADRTLIPIESLENDHIQGKSMSVMFGRGCPQRCSYCFNANYNDLFKESRTFRLRSVENVIAELREIVGKYKLDVIIMHDDIFSYIPMDIMREFSKRYKEEINLPFVAQFRPESVDEEMVVMLKDAGLYLAPMGVECGVESVSRGILERGKCTNEHIKNAFAIMRKHGVKTWSLNLMGLPVDNPYEVDLETVMFNIELKPFWSQWNIMVPIPHTPLWNHLVSDKKWVDPDSLMDSNNLPSGFTATKLQYNDKMTTRKVNNLHKFASIVVKYPFLLPLVKLLILVPENRVYQYIFFFWYGYWKSIGSFDAKISFGLIRNGLQGIKKYLKRH